MFLFILTSVQKIVELCKGMPFYDEILAKYLGDGDEQTLYKVRIQLDQSPNSKFFSCAKIEKAGSGMLLFRQGDKSNGKCYVILKGKVVVIRNNNKETESSVESSDFSDTESQSSDEDSYQKPGMKNLVQRTRSNSILKPTLITPRNAKKQQSRFSPIRILNSNERKENSFSFLVHAQQKKDPPTFNIEALQEINKFQQEQDEIKEKKREQQRQLRKQRRNEKEERKLQKFDNLLKGYPKMMKRIILSYGVPVATIGPGQMFGQYALISNDPRNAGIYCMEDSHFMTFDHQTFSLIKKFYNQEFNQRRKFIQSVLPILESFSEERTIQTIQYFEPEIFQRVSLSHSYSQF